ncbi:hypothetical protein ES703_00025 [subsurface metagenome]
MWAPKGEFKRDEVFGLEVEVDATGSGSSRLLLALWDRLLGRYIGAWATVEPQPPGEYTWNITFNPLDEWYPTPMPGIFEWTVVVGYMEDSTGVVTDSQDFKMPRIVDRVCNQFYCVGVSNPYPAPGEEIAISGHAFKEWYPDPPFPWPICCTNSPLILLTDDMIVPEQEVNLTDDCYFCFFLKAPRFEGGYTYWVRDKGYYAWKSPAIGIWVTAPPACEDYTTKEECEAAGCLWYDNACHSVPPPPPPPPWWDRHKKELMLLGGMGVGVAGIMVMRKF